MVAAVDPIAVYGYRRVGTTIPDYHVQMYAGSETPGRPAIVPERDGILYLHIYAKREEDIDEVYAKLSWLDGWMEMGQGSAYAIRYRLASSNLLQQDDGTLHLAVLYTTHYLRI